MNIFDAFILGIVEGLTEFLPVSSTGHMILTSQILGIAADSFTKSFEIIIQLGAILAVVLLYRNLIFKNINLVLKVITSFVPTAIVGLLLYSFVKEYLLGNVLVVIGSLFVGGIIIILFEKTYRPVHEVHDVDEITGTSDTVEHITYKQAVLVGLFQAIAIIPGISRSAATIIGGEIVGLSRKHIVEFSFLLAIPVMLSATAFDVYKHHEIFTGQNWNLLVVGFVTAFFVAIVAIKSFLAYIQKHSFMAFGVYRIILALVFLGVLYL